eukprot:sb/3466227/
MAFNTGLNKDGKPKQEMEEAACKRLMEHWIREWSADPTLKLNIDTFVTDRNKSVANLLKGYGISINFDVWHLSRNIRKRLKAIAVKHPAIKPWIDEIVNHFWWSANHCGGDKQVLLESWQSCLLHIIGVHDWSPGSKGSADLERLQDMRGGDSNGKGRKVHPKEPQKVFKCGHPPMTRKQQREGNWLQFGSVEYDAIFKLVADTTLSNDIAMTYKFIHTTGVESFHSNKQHLLTKDIHFSYRKHTHLTMLAIVMANNRVHSGPVSVYRGHRYSKAKADYSMRDKKIYDHSAVLEEVVELSLDVARGTADLPPQNVVEDYIPKKLPDTFHKKPFPGHPFLEERHRSRFGN